MSRFLLFAGRDYYPGGGLEDLNSSYDDPSDARDAFENLREQSPQDWQWAHIAEWDGDYLVGRFAWSWDKEWTAWGDRDD